jgi:hypothetical protein
MESKLKITFRDGEIEIAGNREGLRDLADICNGLSELSEEQAQTPGNHWHIDEFMNTAEPGSVPTVILLKRNWPDSDSDTGPDINTGSKPIPTRDIDPHDIRAFCILVPIPPPLSVRRKRSIRFNPVASGKTKRSGPKSSAQNQTEFTSSHF